MSRTYRNPQALNKMFRKPRHKSALKAKTDEYGIRPGAVPPTDYDDKQLSAFREDFSHYKFTQKYNKIYENLKN